MFKYLAITLVAFALLFGGASAARALSTAGLDQGLRDIVANLVTQIGGISTQLAGGVNAIGLTSPSGIINVGTSDGGPLGSGSGYFQTDPARPDIIKLVLRGGEVSVQGTGPGPSGAGGSGGIIHAANQLCVGVGRQNCTSDGVPFFPGQWCGAFAVVSVPLPFPYGVTIPNSIPCLGYTPPACPPGFSMFGFGIGILSVSPFFTCIKG